MEVTGYMTSIARCTVDLQVSVMDFNIHFFVVKGHLGSGQKQLWCGIDRIPCELDNARIYVSKHCEFLIKQMLELVKDNE